MTAPARNPIGIDASAPSPPVLVRPWRPWQPIDVYELWQHRELLWFLVWRDVKVRYKQTALGVAWAVLQPVLSMVILSVFLGRLAAIPSDGVPYPVFVYTALLPWQLFAHALTSSSNSLIENERLVTKVYFPRILLPVSSVLSGVVDLAFAFLVLFPMLAYYGMLPTKAILALPLFTVLALATALAAGLWLSAWNVQYRDVRYAVPLLVPLWMYASPIAYPSTLVPSPWRPLYGLNPLAGAVEGFRWSILGTRPPLGLLLVVSVAVVVALLVGGAFYFRRMEQTFADLL